MASKKNNNGRMRRELQEFLFMPYEKFLAYVYLYELADQIPAWVDMATVNIYKEEINKEGLNTTANTISIINSILEAGNCGKDYIKLLNEVEGKPKIQTTEISMDDNLSDTTKEIKEDIESKFEKLRVVGGDK